MDFARSEAILRSARAYLYESIDRAWQTALTGDPNSDDEKADLRLAFSNATQTAADAVALVFDAGTTRAATRAARANLQSATARREQLRKDVTADVERAVIGLIVDRDGKVRISSGLKGRVQMEPPILDNSGDQSTSRLSR